MLIHRVDGSDDNAVYRVDACMLIHREALLHSSHACLTLAAIYSCHPLALCTACSPAVRCWLAALSKSDCHAACGRGRHTGTAAARARKCTSYSFRGRHESMLLKHKTDQHPIVRPRLPIEATELRDRIQRKSHQCMCVSVQGIKGAGPGAATLHTTVRVTVRAQVLIK